MLFVSACWGTLASPKRWILGMRLNCIWWEAPDICYVCSTSSLPLLTGPPWPGTVDPVRVPLMGQIFFRVMICEVDTLDWGVATLMAWMLYKMEDFDLKVKRFIKNLYPAAPSSCSPNVHVSLFLFLLSPLFILSNKKKKQIIFYTWMLSSFSDIQQTLFCQENKPHVDYCMLYPNLFSGLLSFYGISTIVGYLMPNPLYTHIYWIYRI